MRNKLILKSISSAEVDLINWYPESNEDVFVCLEIEVSFSDGEPGSNYFYVTLATPESLRKYRSAPYLVKNRTLVVSDYNYVTIQDLILEILDVCSRDTWNDSCGILQRYFQWEYEDYETGSESNAT